MRALGYEFHLETASADWTRFEILGGYMPTPREGGGGGRDGHLPDQARGLIG